MPGFKYESTEPYPTYAHIDGPPPDYEGWGFVFDYDHDARPGSLGDGEQRWLGVLIVLPIGVAMSVFAFIGGLPIVRALKSTRRPQRGLCAACGYDRRASPARCPECGTVSGQSAAA